MPKHTSTPWELSHPQGNERDYHVRREKLGLDIFARNDYTQHAPSHHDAAFIVKAVNNHQKLIDMVIELQHYIPYVRSLDDKINSFIEEVKA